MKYIYAMLASLMAFGSTIEITKSQDVTVHVGDTIVIKLQENPTTGYSWQMNFPQTDAVKMLENIYIAPNIRSAGHEMIAGAGGERNCVLKAIKTGTVTIKGKYLRLWEKDIPPVKKFKCTITVK